MKGINRIASQEILDAIKVSMRMGANEFPKVMNSVKNDVIYKKIGEANRWYTNIIGLDEVKKYQDRVVELQDQLLTAQEARRTIGAQLAAVRKKSNDLQDQIHKVKRQEDFQRFLELMKEETELLRSEADINTTFHNQDRLEREIFSAFTNAIRDSHEKQRAQFEYTKYLGIILGILGSFLSFVYISLRKNDLYKLIEASNADKFVMNEDNLNTIKQHLKLIQSDLNDKMIGKYSGIETKINLIVDEMYKNNTQIVKAIKSGVTTNIPTNEKEIDFTKTVLAMGAFICGFYAILRVVSGN